MIGVKAGFWKEPEIHSSISKLKWNLNKWKEVIGSGIEVQIMKLLKPWLHLKFTRSYTGRLCERRVKLKVIWRVEIPCFATCPSPNSGESDLNAMLNLKNIITMFELGKNYLWRSFNLKFSSLDLGRCINLNKSRKCKVHVAKKRSKEQKKNRV